MPPRTSFVAGPTEKARGRQYSRRSGASRPVRSSCAADRSGPSSTGVSGTDTGTSWGTGRSAGAVGPAAGPPSSGGLGPGTSTPGPCWASEGTDHETIVPTAVPSPEEGGPYRRVGETPRPVGRGDAGIRAITATVPTGTSSTWVVV